MPQSAEPIEDLTGYTKAMRKSVIDKLFFFDKVDANTFIDFGCADGTVLRQMQVMFPEYTYIGFDISEDMLARAREQGPDDIQFTSDWKDVQRITEHNQDQTCLMALSVVHEIYSYSKANFQSFWNQILSLGAKYLVFREMCVAKTASRPSDPISVAKVRQNFNSERLAQWESLWGSITENWSLTHFFLTYLYEQNWEREYRENYLPLSMEDFLAKIPRAYQPVFYEHYTLPYLRDCVQRDFGAELQEKTHLKLIFKGSQSL